MGYQFSLPTVLRWRASRADAPIKYQYCNYLKIELIRNALVNALFNLIATKFVSSTLTRFHSFFRN